MRCLFFFSPTLAVGLLDFKVDIVLARPEADFSDQPPSIPAGPNRRVSLQCHTNEYPCRAQPKSIPAVPNRRVSPECPTAGYQYSCSAVAVLQGRQLRGGRETLHFLCNNGFRVMLEVFFFWGGREGGGGVPHLHGCPLFCRLSG